MSRIDKKFVQQYRAAYADGKISDAEAMKLAKSADGNKARESYLRDHLHSDTFESTDGRKAIEKAVGAETQAISTPPVQAPTPAKVTPTSREGFLVELNPPAATEKAAAQAIFGKDQVPEGFTMKKYGKGWEVLVPVDTSKLSVNNIAWDRYQAEVKPAVKQLHYEGADPKFNVPRPGARPVTLPEVDQADRDQAKQVKVDGWSRGTTVAETISGTKSIGASLYDVTLPKAMTAREASEFFFGKGGTPKDSGLEHLPKGSKGPWTQWRVMVPDSYTPRVIDTEGKGNGMSQALRMHLLDGSTKANRTLPEWIGENTAAAIKAKQLPPKGVEVSHPKEGIAVWKEGRGVFWLDEKTGSVQGFERKKGDGLGTKIWNNWNEKRIMLEGYSPEQAAELTVKDMHSTNKQMLMAFAQAMAANRGPEGGVFQLGVKTVDVTGKFGLHNQPTGTDDVYQAARDLEAKRSQAHQPQPR